MFKVVLFFTELWTKLIGLIFYVFCEGGAGETVIDNLNLRKQTPQKISKGWTKDT